jgi:hypothetical protein
MPARPDGPLRDFRAAKMAEALAGGLALQSLLKMSLACTHAARSKAVSW